MNYFSSLLKVIIALAILAGTQYTNAQQWGDYTLYATQNGTTAVLCDTNGTTFKTWTFSSTAKTGYSTYLLPGGTLLRTVARSGNSFTGGPICGEVQKVDYNGNIIWDYVYSTTTYCTHHDICPMPNGNVLLIAYESKTSSEVTAAGCSQSITMWPDKIVEVQPTGTTTGTVVWEWHAWDHLCQSYNSSKANYVTNTADHPELLNINYNTQKDWLHMNGIDYNPILDQIVWSSHNMSEWYVIDHSTTTAEAASHSGGKAGKGGDILYRWGKPAVYGASGTAILNVTHDAHWIPEGVPNAGYIVGFNNKGVSSSQSSVDQISPPINGFNYTYTQGQAYQPSTYTKRHACNGYTSNMGNSQQLPNGNMLVCIALSGSIYEINPAGTSIWSKTVSGSVPQAFRYEKCYINNAAPAIPTISENNGTLVCDSTAATYQWYYNGVQLQGETNQAYTPTQDGVYLVRITDSNGCVYRYSEDFFYTAPTGIKIYRGSSDLIIFPNPSTGIITIKDDKYTRERNFEVLVSDASGKLMMKAKGTTELDLSALDNGFYFVTLTSPSIGTVTKKVSVIK